MKTQKKQKKDGLVRANVIADHYDVTERCVLYWKDKGLIPFVKINQTVRFDFEKVKEAIEGKAVSK